MALDTRLDIRWRLKLVYIIMFLFGMLILAKAFKIGILERDYWLSMNEDKIMRIDTILPIRGTIYADEGRFLVISVPIYDVFMDFKYLTISNSEFNKNIDSLAYCLSTIVKNKSKGQIKQEFINGKKKRQRYMLVAKDLNHAEFKALKKFPIFRLGRYKAGYVVDSRFKRERPYDQLARKTIGRPQEIVDLKRYKVAANYKPKKGFGLEAYYDSVLTGKLGRRLVQKMSDNQWRPIDSDLEIEPVDGKDIVTAIDITIQDIAEEELKKQIQLHHAESGCVVVMEVETGYIKAMANLTRFNNDSNLVEGDNYAVKYKGNPGSTIKLASYMAAIEDGYIKSTDSIDTKGGVVFFKGKPVKDSKLGGYGKITVKQAFELSSNTAITQIINRSYQTKPQQFIDRLKSFGFDAKTGIDMLGEEAPEIKNANSKDWSGISLPWISYGYESGITPLQMLNFYNAVANNGKLMKPQLVKEIRYRGQTLQKMEPVVLKESICKKETIDEVMPMLKGVVKNGTATNLINPYFEIAGKTGTTQLGVSDNEKKHQKYQSSFVGFFPAEKPKYSCIVVIFNPSENGYYGNIVAGPVFKEVADKLYATRLEMHINKRDFAVANTQPSKSVSGKAEDLKNIFGFMNIPIEGDDASEWTKLDKSNNSIKLREKTLAVGRAPDVRGMGLRDALYMLENLGYRVQIKGKGIVVRQSIEPGSQTLKNQLIEIELS